MVEIFPGKLYSFDKPIPLDGRVTWVPETAFGFQPAHCYVLLTGSVPLIVDPGLAFAEDEVITGLQGLISEGAPVEVFLTRSHADSTGNLGAIIGSFRVTTIYTTPVLDPRAELAPVADGPDLASPSHSRLEVIDTPLRLLGTHWGYDHETKTLFTSDSFTHTVTSRADECTIIDSPERDIVTRAEVKDHLYATFPWLPEAVTQPIAASLRKIISSHDVHTIAPARGCVLQGAAVVRRHSDMVVDVLNSGRAKPL